MRVGLIIQAFDQATSIFAKIRAGFAQFSKDIEAANKKASASFQLAGNLRNAAAGVSTFANSIKAPLTDAMDVFTEFEYTMAQVASNAENLTAAEFDTLKEKALEMGAATAFSATEAAQGMLELSKAGLDTNQVMKTIPATLNLATAEAISLSSAATITADTMNQFGLGVKDIEHIGDVLSKTASVSTTDVTALAESFKNAAPQAAALGISLESLAGFTAALSGAGIKGGVAGTALKDIIAGFGTVSRMQQKAARSIGLDPKKMRANMSDPLSLIKDLDAALTKSGKNAGDQNTVLTKMFGREGAPSIQALLKQFRTLDEVTKKSKLETSLAKVNDNMGTTSMKASIMGMTSKQALDNFSGAIETLKIRVGGALAKAVLPFLATLSDVITRIGNWTKNHEALTGTLVKFAAVAAALATLLAGALFTAVTLVSTHGAVVMTVAYTKAAWALGGAFRGAILGVLRPLAMLFAAQFPLIAQFLAVAAPVLIVTAAIAGLSLAIIELVRHWKELDFLEGFKGILDTLEDDGVLSTMGQLFDPSALMGDIKHDMQGPMGGVGAIPSGGGTNKLEISVTGEDGAKVTDVASSGPMETNVDSGRNLGM